MAWKTVSTDADITVDLEEFNDAQLLQELIARGYIDESEADRIVNRVVNSIVNDTDYSEIAAAWEYASRGDKNEALVHIERALGNEWIGRLT